jgi:sigma-B regulation protein RsbU (phosphoserine phosphatase)
VHNLDVHDDPVLGGHVAEFGSCIVIPMFEDGAVREWIVCFYAGAEEATSDHLIATMQLANHIGATRRYLRAIRVSRALTEELSRQFDELSRVQRSLLPRELPDIPGVRVATSYRTSKQAGGDFYGFNEIGPGHWGIVIADVSGHGAAAATVMAMMQSIIASFDAIRQGEPMGLIDHLNSRLCDSLVGGMFVTAFFMLYDTDSGEVYYSRCGHNAPRVLRAATGRIETMHQGHGPPLGVDAGLEVHGADDTLAPGDILVLYTDGVTEAFGRDGEMFGTERLDGAIRDAGSDPEAVVSLVQRRLDAFTGGADRVDDQTMVVLRREPHA